MTQPLDPVSRQAPALPPVAASRPPARRERDARREGDRRGGRDGEHRPAGEAPLVDAEGHVDIRA